MMKIVIGDDDCLISKVQSKWFTKLTDESTVELPTEIENQPINVRQFLELVDLYQTQISNNLVDYQRPRSVLEHYLGGILDDQYGSIRQILDFILELGQIKVDVILYQLVAKGIPNCNIDDWIESYHEECSDDDTLTHRIVYFLSDEIFAHLFKYLDHLTVCNVVCSYGNLNMLKYAHKHGCPWNELACRYAACYGHLEILKYLHQNGCPWNSDTCTYACDSEDLEILKYAHENGCPWNERTSAMAGSHELNILRYVHQNGCPWDKDTCKYAARCGNLDCLQYAHNNGCPWDENTCRDAASGRLDCLQYAHEYGCYWNEKTCNNAARYGHLDCLQYAYENGCPFDYRTLLKYAKQSGISEGNDNCLISEEQCKWFKTLEYTSTDRLIGIPDVIADQSIDITQSQQLVELYQTQIEKNVIDYERPRSILEHYLDGILDDIDEHNSRILDFIIGNESLDVDIKLYQLVSNYCGTIYSPNYYGIDWIDSFQCRVIRLGSLEIFIHLFSYLDHINICAMASSYGQLDFLKYAHQHGCVLDSHVCEYSAGNGHLNCLQYAHDNKYPRSEQECTYAAQYGQLDCLQYLHQNNCPWDVCACSSASRNGQLECLKYLHENNCPWNEYTCEFAAAHGHLECLRYAHENGCSWDYGTCEWTVKNGNGHPFNPDEILKCVEKSDNTDIIEYVTHVMWQ